MDTFNAFNVPEYKDRAARQKYKVREIMLRVRQAIRNANWFARTHVRETRQN